jgi:hypothetical protein
MGFVAGFRGGSANIPPFVESLRLSLKLLSTCFLLRDCRNLRKLILSRRPANSLSLLLEVGNIECVALIAERDEFPVIRENLTLLSDRVRSAGDQ